MLYTAAGIGFVMLGFAIGWYALRPLAVVPSVLRREVKDPSEVTDAGTVVVCRGVANESSDILRAPFTGSRCLGFEFEVTERQPFGIGVPWFHAHLDDGVTTRPFSLSDPSGFRSVVPSAKRFTLDTKSTVISVSASDKPPERIQRFIDIRDELGPVASWIRAVPGLGMRRYVERRIDPGEEYLVAGRTERRQNEIILAGDIVITDRTPRRFAIARLRKAAFPTVIALTFIMAGFGGIVL